MTEIIDIEVAYASASEQRIVALQVPQGTTAQQAVERSGLSAIFAEIDMSALRLGVFGKVVTLQTVLQAHDRVEIYRPLRADPKEVRRRRAARAAG